MEKTKKLQALLFSDPLPKFYNRTSLFKLFLYVFNGNSQNFRKSAEKNTSMVIKFWGPINDAARENLSFFPTNVSNNLCLITKKNRTKGQIGSE